MNKKILEMVSYAIEEGIDPVNLIYDYYHEKDSYISWRQAYRIVKRAKQIIKERNKNDD